MNAKQLRKQLYKLDESALTELVAAYRLPLIAFVCTYIHDEFIAEDIVSEVFVRLLVKEPKLRDATALKTYLFSAAKNVSIDYLRKRKREKDWVEEWKNTAGYCPKTERYPAKRWRYSGEGYPLECRRYSRRPR